MDRTNALFLDIDERIDKAKQHFQIHNNAWMRKSANGNLHAIIYDPCDNCKIFGDKLHKGFTLFDNRGNKWADAQWVNAKTEETKIFKSTTFIHFIIQGFETFHWYFLSFGHLKRKLDEINSHIDTEDVGYTFHLVQCKEIATVTSSWLQDESKAKKKFGEWKNDLDLNKFEGLEKIHETYKRFVESIPSAFIYNKLRF